MKEIITSKKTIKDIDVKGKRVLVRVDFNVVLNKKGEIIDDYKITASLETLEYLLKKQAKIILLTHLGKPHGEKVEKLKVDCIAEYLSHLLQKPVMKFDECIGEKAIMETKKLKSGEILLMENVRFHEEDFKNDEKFSQNLAKLGDVFVNDSFGTCHRKHSSTIGIAEYLPTVAGLLVEKEIEKLKEVSTKTEYPFCIIIGGSKIDTKIEMILSFLNQNKEAEGQGSFLFGGAIGTTFLYAQGYQVGESLVEREKLDEAQELMLMMEKYNEKLLIPTDVRVADDFSERSAILDIPVDDITFNMKIVDIGHRTVELYKEEIKKAKTIFWTGPMGAFEVEKFNKGTLGIAEAVANSQAKSIVGGGDTLIAFKDSKLREKVYHLSTGGGAMLKFMANKELPGLSVIEDKF